jgi:hypothetical protein
LYFVPGPSDLRWAQRVKPYYCDREVVGVFVRFRAPLQPYLKDHQSKPVEGLKDKLRFTPTR